MSSEPYEVNGIKFEIRTEHKGMWWGKWICQECGDSRYSGQPFDEATEATAHAKVHASIHTNQAHTPAIIK